MTFHYDPTLTEISRHEELELRAIPILAVLGAIADLCEELQRISPDIHLPPSTASLVSQVRAAAARSQARLANRPTEVRNREVR